MKSEIHEFREEQLNSELSRLLEERGILSTPETIKHTSRGKRMPDITIKHYSGIQVIIEGKINDAANTSQMLLDQVKGRIEGRLAQICIAVLYPENLRRASNTKELRENIKNSSLSIRIISNIDDSDWIETDIDGLTDLLRRTYENLINAPLLVQSVKELNDAIEGAADVFARKQTTITRFYEILSGESDTDSDKSGDMRICRIAALTLSNAMIFQEILADQEPKVLKLRPCLEAEDYTTRTLEVWQTVLGFNYFPIFHIAREVLLGVPTSSEADRVLREIADVALKLTQRRAALKHDLMGRIYHRLLAEPKYFGAFYTTIPAATLLLKLALHPKYWEIDWDNVESIRDFRVCDFACGTGTLLKAAQQSIVENYIHYTAKPDITPEPDKIHKILVENILWGFDVLPFATHLAASTLAMNAPGIRFDEMQLYCLDHGGKGKSIALGSLDFISSPSVLAQTTFSSDMTHGGDQISGKGVRKKSIQLPKINLCVMNPPFTRSTRGNLLFGSLPETQRGEMQRLLKERINVFKQNANINAGLGSVFVAVGDKYLDKKGMMALVLPQALLSGESWENTRNLLSKNYSLLYIVVSHEYNNWNFSENTNLSECLIIAKKCENPEGDVTFINLSKKPSNPFNALALAEMVIKASPASIDGNNICQIKSGKMKIAEAIKIPQSALNDNKWIMGAAFANTDLCRCGYHLARGDLFIPSRGVIAKVPFIRLDKIGTVGPGGRRIYAAFSTTNDVTAYPAVVDHNSTEMGTLVMDQYSYLYPSANARRGYAEKLATMAGNLIIVERMRCNTYKLTSAYTTKPVLGIPWWPVKIQSNKMNPEDLSKLMVLWFNSTLGIVSLLSQRLVTSGSWVKFLKPSIESMQVPDFEKLSPEKIKAALSTFNDNSDSGLMPISDIMRDPIRRKIDDAIGTLLDLPPLTVLRELLVQEPFIIAESYESILKTPRTKQISLNEIT